jgi:hypothetical protein
LRLALHVAKLAATRAGRSVRVLAVWGFRAIASARPVPTAGLILLSTPILYKVPHRVAHLFSDYFEGPVMLS